MISCSVEILVFHYIYRMPSFGFDMFKVYVPREIICKGQTLAFMISDIVGLLLINIKCRVLWFI